MAEPQSLPEMPPADEPLPKVHVVPPKVIPSPPAEPPTAHEESDVDATALGRFLVIMTVSLVVVGGLVYWQYRRFERLARANDPPPLPRAEERQPPPLPHLQIHEVADMDRLRSEQRSLLERLEWIDPQARQVRIPIERAIAIVAKEGIRRWPAPAEQKPADSTATRSTPDKEAAPPGGMR